MCSVYICYIPTYIVNTVYTIHSIFMYTYIYTAYILYYYCYPLSYLQLSICIVYIHIFMYNIIYFIKLSVKSVRRVLYTLYYIEMAGACRRSIRASGPNDWKRTITNYRTYILYICIPYLYADNEWRRRRRHDRVYSVVYYTRICMCVCVMRGGRARKIQEFISAAASDVKSGTFDTVRWPRTRTTEAAAATAHTHTHTHKRASSSRRPT